MSNSDIIYHIENQEDGYILYKFKHIVAHEVPLI